MTPTTKNALLLIFLAAVSSNASDKWQFDYETGEDNFSKNQRWKTWALNIVPGLGSHLIMDDFTGTVVQLALGGSGIVATILYFALNDYDADACNRTGGAACSEPDEFVIAGGILYSSSFIYNIYRSITYNKPQKTAYSENSGFNIAVLPNRNGKLNAFLIYNKAF